MDWFELAVHFHGDPKCLALRARLKEPLAECYVSRIYAYCYEHETDQFDSLDAVTCLERAAEWSGRRHRTGALFSALLDTGFIERRGDLVIVHGVGKRLQKVRQFREKHADKMRSWRSRKTPRDPSRDEGGDPSRDPSRDLPRDPSRDLPRDGHVTSDQTRPDLVVSKDLDHRETDLPRDRDQPRPDPKTDLRQKAEAEASEPPGRAGGTDGAFDGPRAARDDVVERVRLAVSDALGVVGKGGQRIALGGGAKLGETIRAIRGAVERCGEQAVVEACVARGREMQSEHKPPEVMGAFRGLLAALQPAAAVGPRGKKLTEVFDHYDDDGIAVYRMMEL